MSDDIGMAKVTWRDFNREAVMVQHAKNGHARVMENYGREAPRNAHRAFMDACSKDSRGFGNAGFIRATAPYWDARDIAFYFWGVSNEAAMIEGYKAMQAHYNMDAPSWAWW